MNAHEAIEAYLDSMRVRGVSATSVRSVRSDLAHFARWCGERDVAELGVVEVAKYAAALCALSHSRSYIAKIAGCVRRLLGWLTRSGVLIVDPSAPLRMSFGAKSLPQVLSEKESATLVDAAPDVAPWPGHPTAPWALRDKAILELLYSSGLRRAEITSLDVSDVDLAGGFVTVRRGKGAKDRIVPPCRSAADAIREYIERERPLWLASPNVTALSIVLRHTVATHLLRAGAGLRQVHEILGYASIQTTTRYTHLTIGDLRRAHAKAHPRGKKCPQ